MPTWVHDRLRDRWLVRAADRADRPRTHGQPVEGCPFCPGNEHATPPEITRAPATGPWRVRVFPNLYPAVTPDRDAPGALVHAAGVAGRHEVVATTADHDRTLADLDDDEITEVVTVLLTRVETHLAEGAAHSQAFVNQGAAAGATVAHPHAQVVAVDVVPPLVAAERAATEPQDCVVCAELEPPDRHALRTADHLVVAPEASLERGELLVAPVSHGEASAGSLGVAVRDALRALREVEGDVAYNVVFHPVTTAVLVGHAHAHIVPRTSVPAGFELGTGLHLSAASPERTARAIRQASSGSNSSAAELMQ